MWNTYNQNLNCNIETNVFDGMQGALAEHKNDCFNSTMEYNRIKNRHMENASVEWDVSRPADTNSFHQNQYLWLMMINRQSIPSRLLIRPMHTYILFVLFWCHFPALERKVIESIGIWYEKHRFHYFFSTIRKKGIKVNEAISLCVKISKIDEHRWKPLETKFQ